jgi:hypothetical protein
VAISVFQTEFEARRIMILGMTTFTFVHVVISLIAILSGFIVVFGMLAGERLDGMTVLFLLTTVLTSVTGFLFPYHGITPGIVLGILSLIALAIAIYARYGRHLSGGLRKAYVITAAISLYFNVFVLIVQSFMKVPALHAMAPTQTEPPFKITQLVVLVLFILLTIAATVRFREKSFNRA